MTEIQGSVLRLVQAMFNAAPNASILSEFSVIVADSGGSTVPLANLLAANPIFLSEMYPSFLNNSEFGEAFIENLVGDLASETNKAWAAGEIARLLNDGMSRGEVIVFAVDELTKIDSTNETWADAASQFLNKVEVAGSYAISAQGSASTLDILQAVTASVTESQETVAAAVAAFTDSLEGVVVDGYIAGATVFVDLDGDSVQDPDEPSTTTDARGEWSFPGGENAFGQIVSVGGIDIATGQPFKGTLTAPAASNTVNPLTTLIDAISKTPGATQESSQVQVATALGLPPGTDLTRFDPLSAINQGTDSEKALALQVQAAVAQVITIVQQTAAVLQGSGTTENGSAAAFAAVANAISVAASAAGLSIDPDDPDAETSDGTIDLTSTTTIANIVKAAATEAGATEDQQTAVADLADDASTIITNLNTAIDDAISDGSASPDDALIAIALVQVVSGNTADNVEAQTAGLGNISIVANNTSGNNLSNSIDAAGSELGDVNGDGQSDAASSGGEGSTPITFTVTETAGIVEFGGTATGDITVAWAGDTGDSVATFTRGGITASTEPDFETGVAGTATQITLASGQTLVMSLAEATTLVANVDTIIDGDGSLSLTDTNAAASALTTLEADAKFAVDLDAAASTTLTGNGAEFAALIANAAITLSSNYIANVSGTPSVANLNTIDADTTAIITATPAADSLANLNTLTGAGNAYTLTINDAGTVAAADITTLDGKTTVAVDASSAATVSGTGAELSTALASAGINLAANVALTVIGNITATQQAILDGNTTAAITATISDGDLTTLANLADATGNNALTVTVTDTSADAAALNTLDGKTSATVDATAVATLTGSAAAIDTAMGAAGLNLSGSVAANINSGSATTAQQASIDGNTTGIVTATIAENDLATLAGLANAHSNNALTVTVADGSATAAALNTLDGKTSVAVTATAVATVTGAIADVNTALGAAGINLASDVALTVSGTPSVADLNAADANTTGVITATVATDSLANLNNLTGTGNAYTLTISDAGTVAAADLNTLDGKTTIAIDATSAATISGTGTELSTALGSAGITTAAGVALNVSGSITTAQQATLDGSTTAAVSATILENDLATLAGLADAHSNNALTVTVTDASATAAALNTLDGKTSVAVTATAVGTLTGTMAEVNTALSSAGLALATDVALTVSGTPSVADLNTAAGNTTGVITATLTTDSLANLNNLTGTGNAYTLTINDAGAVAASDLNTLDGKTTVAINASAAGTITGTAAAIAAVLVSSGVTQSASVNVTPDAGAIAAVDLVTLQTNTTGTVDLSNVTSITLADLANDSFEAAPFNGITLNLNGTGDNGSDLATLNLLAGGETIDLSGIIVDADDIGLTINGGAGDDIIIAPAANVIINGGAGSDMFTGGANSDTIDLGSADGAADTVIQAANDSADTGAINNANSGSGNFADGDTIDIAGADIIQNFEDGIDRIVLSDTVSAATQDSSDPDGGVGSKEFTAIRGNFSGLFTVDLSSGADMLVLYDASGSGDIEMLYLPGAGGATITAADFSSFTVTETAGVVEFGGTASGNITVSWSGTVGNSIATFMRGSITAVTKPDFSGTANAITLAAGQQLEIAIADAVSAAAALTLNSVEPLLISDTATAAQLASVDGNTTAPITATISDNSMAALAAITDGNGNNALTITVTDTSVNAAALNTLDGKTSVQIDAAAITTLTGSAADIAVAITSSGLNLAPGVNVTLDAGSIKASDLDTIENNTTADINMSAVTDVTLEEGESFSFNASTVHFEAFNLTGANDNGGESFIVNMAPGGGAVYLSNIAVDSNDVSVTINGSAGNDTITGTSSGDVINTNDGTEDIVILTEPASSNDADTITGFLTFSDKISFSNIPNAVGTVADLKLTPAPSLSGSNVFYLSGGSVGDADSAAAAAGFINGIVSNNGFWSPTSPGDIGWIVVQDDDSAAVYKWQPLNNDIQIDSVDLTLIAVIAGTVDQQDIFTI